MRTHGEGADALACGCALHGGAGAAAGDGFAQSGAEASYAPDLAIAPVHLGKKEEGGREGRGAEEEREGGGGGGESAEEEREGALRREG